MTVDVRLNAIVDPERANGRSLADLTRMVVAGGATLIQLRDKHGDTRQMIETARAILAVLAGTGVPLVVNDRVDVALVAAADGVHVGQGDMPFAVLLEIALQPWTVSIFTISRAPAVK